MNAIEAISQQAKQDWQNAGHPEGFTQRYTHGDIICEAQIACIFDERGEEQWQLTLNNVDRYGGDPNTDVVNYDDTLYRETLPYPEEIVTMDAATESNIELLNRAIRQVTNAAADIADYDDESESLNHHANELASAEASLNQILRNLTPDA